MSSYWNEETERAVYRELPGKRHRLKRQEARGTNTQTSLSSLRPISSHAPYWLNSTSFYMAAQQDTEQGEKNIKRQGAEANRRCPAQEANVV